MDSARFSPGPKFNLIIMFCMIFFLCTAGCVQPLLGDDSLPAPGFPPPGAGNDTIHSALPYDLPKSLEVSMAGPASGPDKIPTRPAAIPVLKATPSGIATGPTLNAKGGSEVNMTEIVIEKETIAPV